MGADTSAVKKKHEWNPMEKHRDMEGEGKGDGHQRWWKPGKPEPAQ